MRRRWHGLTGPGWAGFIFACIVLSGAAFWGTVKAAAVLDPGPPAVLQSPAAGVSTASPAAPARKQHPRHPATHRVTHRASHPGTSPGQARIPGVGSTGGPGVISVPATHRYRPRPSSAYVPPATRTPVPAPETSSPAPAPDQEPSTDSPAPGATETVTEPPGGWAHRAAVTAPSAPATDEPSSVLPDVPGGGSGWIEGQ